MVLTAQHRLGIVYPLSLSTIRGQDQLDLFRPMVKWRAPNSAVLSPARDLLIRPLSLGVRKRTQHI